MQLEQYFILDKESHIYILGIIGSALLIQLIYYLFFYVRILGKPKFATKNAMPLSVIIAARNEAENLRKFLPLIMKQNYPDFEVIIVNDRSGDNTIDVLVEYRKKYPKLYFTTIEENRLSRHGKKLALTIGIKAAKHEHLVFTDADCYPVSDNWLQSIADGYREHTDIVLAYGGYERQKGLLNRIIRYDTLWIGMQYLSFAKAGMPYMGVGRNLSYKKSIYEAQRGFSGHYHLKSGDDDLFVNKAANRKNTNVQGHPDSITRSVPEHEFSRWLLQKVRHFSSAPHYRFWHKIILGGELLSRFVFYAGIIIALIMRVPAGYIASLFLVRLSVQYIVVGIAAKRLNEKGIALFTPILDVILPIIHLRISFAGIFIRKRKQRLWK